MLCKLQLQTRKKKETEESSWLSVLSESLRPLVQKNTDLLSKLSNFGWEKSKDGQFESPPDLKSLLSELESDIISPKGIMESSMNLVKGQMRSGKKAIASLKGGMAKLSPKGSQGSTHGSSRKNTSSPKRDKASDPVLRRGQQKLQ